MTTRSCRTATAALLFLLLAPRAAPAAATPGGAPARHPELEAVGGDHNPVAWLVSSASGSLLRWLGAQVVNEAVNYTLDRTDVRERLWRATDHLRGLEKDRSLPPEVRAEFRRIGTSFRQFAAILDQNDKSDQQVRSELRALRRDFDAHLRDIDARVARLDTRLAAVEREQRRQLRTMVELQERVAAMEVRIVDHEGRLVRVESATARHDRQITDLESTVYPDPNRFLRHDSYLTLGALYANSDRLQNDAAIGGEASYQYNFNKFFGVFGLLALAPISASDVAQSAEGSAMRWESVSGFAGGNAILTPPESPVSFQVGAGGGITQSKLLYYAPGVDRTAPNSASELANVANVAFLVKADLGVSPPAYGLEPVLSAGYLALLDDMTYRHGDVETNAGRGMWYMSLGLRVRSYLRGRQKEGS